MSEKRRDHKGRILKQGESQRKDLLYQYRYTDKSGKRRTVYSSDLKELREKEKQIQLDFLLMREESSIDATLLEATQAYLDSKRNLRKSSIRSYTSTINMLAEEEFAHRKIKDIKTLDAKEWILDMYDRGISLSKIKSFRKLIKPTFTTICESDPLMNNPFSFKLDFISSKKTPRIPLNPKQQAALLEFVRTDSTFSKYYDMIVVLLDTGIRASELCGLTIDNVDYENNCLTIDHQLQCPNLKTGFYVEAPKSESSIRNIPLFESTVKSLRHAIETRPAIEFEPTVDGYSGFIFLRSTGVPYRDCNIGAMLNNLLRKYSKTQNPPIPKLYPHLFRHTACTNMVNSGMNVSTVQYIMGHSNISMTLDVYTYSNYDSAISEVKRIEEKREGKQNRLTSQEQPQTTPFTTPFAC